MGAPLTATPKMTVAGDREKFLEKGKSGVARETQGTSNQCVSSGVAAARLPSIGEEAGSKRTSDFGVGEGGATVIFLSDQRLLQNASKSSAKARFGGWEVTRIFMQSCFEAEGEDLCGHGGAVTGSVALPVAIPIASPFFGLIEGLGSCAGKGRAQEAFPAKLLDDAELKLLAIGQLSRRQSVLQNTGGRRDGGLRRVNRKLLGPGGRRKNHRKEGGPEGMIHFCQCSG